MKDSTQKYARAWIRSSGNGNASRLILATVIVGLLASTSVACEKGCEEHSGVCACDARPDVEAESYAKPSDEKPRRSQQPEWQTGEVNASLAPSKASDDAKMDQEKTKADAEGKKAAGL